MTEPIKVELVKPPSAPPSPYAEPTKYLRETAKWITGGAVAAFATIALGASLANMGALPDSGENVWRLRLAVGGLLASSAAVGFILYFALGVFTVGLASFEDVRRPEPKSEHKQLKKDLEAAWSFEDNNWTWDLVANDDDFKSTKNHIKSAMGFIYVRRSFLRLRLSLMIGGPIALAGIAIFAWAANPPENFGKPQEADPVSEKTIEFQYNGEGKLIRQVETSDPDIADN